MANTEENGHKTWILEKISQQGKKKMENKKKTFNIIISPRPNSNRLCPKKTSFLGYFSLCFYKTINQSYVALVLIPFLCEEHFHFLTILERNQN